MGGVTEGGSAGVMQGGVGGVEGGAAGIVNVGDAGGAACDEGWTGANCDECDAGYYGSSCTACGTCDYGTCEDGLTRTGDCCETVTPIAEAADNGNEITINHEMAAVADPFTVEWDVTPSGIASAVVGVSGNPTVDSWAISAVVRFNTAGIIDAYDYNAYAHVGDAFGYVADTTYHVRMVVRRADSRYAVWVTPDGGTETQIADDYQFRTGVYNVTEFVNWVIISHSDPNLAPIKVCNFSLRVW